MQNKSHFPHIEKGYACCIAIFLLMTGTVIYAMWFINKVSNINKDIAEYNRLIIEKGMYVQITQMTIDYSIFNWIIAAESAALSVTVACQLIKKRVCNVYQYAEEWIDKWFKEPEVRPYITQIVQSWMCSNTTTLNVSK